MKSFFFFWEKEIKISLMNMSKIKIQNFQSRGGESSIQKNPPKYVFKISFLFQLAMKEMKS